MGVQSRDRKPGRGRYTGPGERWRREGPEGDTGGEEWSDSGPVLKGEPRGLAGRAVRGRKRKRGFKEASTVLCLSKCLSGTETETTEHGSHCHLHTHPLCFSSIILSSTPFPDEETEAETHPRSHSDRQSLELKVHLSATELHWPLTSRKSQTHLLIRYFIHQVL